MNSKDEKSRGLAAMKEAHRHPKYLTKIDPLSGKEVITDDPLLRELLVEVVSTIPYMGLPKPLPTPKGKRGPKIKRTQYDRAYELRKDLYQTLVRLPHLRKKAAEARREIGKPLCILILKIADNLSPTTPRYKLANKILLRLQLMDDFNQTDEKTVRTTLNKYFWPKR